MPKMTAKVIAERINEYKSNTKGWTKDRLITLVDMETAKGCTFRDTIEYKLSEEEERRFPPESLLQKVVTFGLSKVAMFGKQGGAQRLAFEGTIVEVLNAKPA